MSKGSFGAWLGVQQERPRVVHRPLHEIAAEIRADWTVPYFGARPYIQAMGTMTSIHDQYGADDAEYVVLYFLANARSWRGEVARRIKQELNGILYRYSAGTT